MSFVKFVFISSEILFCKPKSKNSTALKINLKHPKLAVYIAGNINDPMKFTLTWISIQYGLYILGIVWLQSQHSKTHKFCFVYFICDDANNFAVNIIMDRSFTSLITKSQSSKKFLKNYFCSLKRVQGL